MRALRRSGSDSSVRGRRARSWIAEATSTMSRTPRSADYPVSSAGRKTIVSADEYHGTDFNIFSLLAFSLTTPQHICTLPSRHTPRRPQQCRLRGLCPGAPHLVW